MVENLIFTNEYTFGWKFFKRLFKLAPLLYPKTFELSTFFTLITFLCSILNEIIAYYIGLVPGKMYSALIGKDEPGFWHLFWTGTFMYIAKCLLLALISLFSWLLYLIWRKNIVNELQNRYFSNQAYYKINCLNSQGIDNPDQRLTQDVERMCNQLAVTVLPVSLIGPFVVVYYTWKTWKTAGPFGVGVIYLYFLIGTTVNKVLISPLSKWSARVELNEGNFRYKHVTIRDNSESIAFYGAEVFETFQSNKSLYELLRCQLRLICWRFPNDFWKQFFDYYGGLLSYAIQYFPIFLMHSYDGRTDLPTIISNNAFVYIYLVNSFTKMTDLAMTVGEMSGILQRVAALLECMENMKDYDFYDNFEVSSRSTMSSILENSSPYIYEFEHVTYALPNNENYVLLEDLNFKLSREKNLLITGPSGAGKSSLLRILSGLWNLKTGILRKNIEAKDVIYIPQKIYFSTGNLSLRQQIVFPNTVDNFALEGTDQIEEILRILKLDYLLDRCNGLDTPVDFEWKEMLTPGELQRLSFARILYQKPKLAILDESTNSLPVDMEILIYNLLKTNRIQYISVGHRNSLKQLHDLELQLIGKTGYEIIERIG